MTAVYHVQAGKLLQAGHSREEMRKAIDRKIKAVTSSLTIGVDEFSPKTREDDTACVGCRHVIALIRETDIRSEIQTRAQFQDALYKTCAFTALPVFSLVCEVMLESQLREHLTTLYFNAKAKTGGNLLQQFEYDMCGESAIGVGLCRKSLEL